MLASTKPAALAGRVAAGFAVAGTIAALALAAPSGGGVEPAAAGPVKPLCQGAGSCGG